MHTLIILRMYEISAIFPFYSISFNYSDKLIKTLFSFVDNIYLYGIIDDKIFFLLNRILYIYYLSHIDNETSSVEHL